jgi:hypothetical protein
MNARLERKLRSLAAVIVAGVIAGVSPDTSSKTFWSSFIYSAVLSVVMNLALGVTNIIGPRAFLNFFIGRYHTPVEEKRFVIDQLTRPATASPAIRLAVSGSATSANSACSPAPARR